MKPGNLCCPSTTRWPATPPANGPAVRSPPISSPCRIFDPLFAPELTDGPLSHNVGAMRNRTSLGDFLDSQMPAALEWLQRMVAINSFTANRDGVNRLGRLTAECFEPLGFTAEFVPSMDRGWGDHLALTRRGRSARNIALVSHLDTVFSPEEEARNNFHWQPDGDRIYGPGTHDIKGGTVMIWLVLQALRVQAPAAFEDTTWKLFFNSSEET